MKIMGKGSIPCGKYQDVKVKGSVKLCGEVECESFCSSGKIKGESLSCLKDLSVNGKALFSADVKAKNFISSGKVNCLGNVEADEEITIFGKAKSKGNLKCNSLSVNGKLTAKEMIAEKVDVKGRVVAEKIDGKNITVKKGRGVNVFLVKKSNTQIFHSIKGEDVKIERVNCPLVVGKTVRVLQKCKIDLVQYSERVEISPKAKVNRTEKI